MFIFFLLFLFIIFSIYNGRRQKARAREDTYQYFQKVTKMIDAHGKTLARKRNQSILVDDYGVKDVSGWEKEKEYFAEKVIIAQLGFPAVGMETTIGMDKIREIDTKTRILEILEEQARAYDNGSPSVDRTKVVTGQNYEFYCAQILENCGWSARTTVGSGDQGADVFAEKGRFRVVIQCKYYSSNVGNKAVQEVLAAMQFYDYPIGAVVSNAGFTRSAQSLANTSGVLLLNQDDLEVLEDMLFEKEIVT